MTQYRLVCDSNTQCIEISEKDSLFGCGGFSNPSTFSFCEISDIVGIRKETLTEIHYTPGEQFIDVKYFRILCVDRPHRNLPSILTAEEGIQIIEMFHEYRANNPETANTV